MNRNRNPQNCTTCVTENPVETGAIFDATGCYRYSLWRSWDEQSARVGFVMLNPSRADAMVNDPTIRRCISFAQLWGFGSLEVVNLFAYRTVHPAELRHAPDPIGPENDRYLATLGQRVDQLVLAWGNEGRWQSRNAAAILLLGDRLPALCLGITRLGQPKHPLYVRRDTPLQQLSEVSCCATFSLPRVPAG